jgi:uncharacterized protein (DUF1778 family)
MSEPHGVSARRHTLRVDAGPLTQPFLQHCKAYGLKEGEMLRRLIAGELQAPPPAPMSRRVRVKSVFGQVDATRIRKTVRLTRSELDVIEKSAALVGMDFAEYLVAVARSHAGDASLSRDERVLLANSNYQLLAIGRNLNQVAKILNAGQAMGLSEFTSIRAATAAVREHVKMVSSFITSVRARWMMNEER